MRTLTMAALAAILLLGAQAATCVAQGGSSDAGGGMKAATLNGNEIIRGFWTEAPQWGGGGVPSGDYQQTCRDIRMNGDLLQARCQKRDGGWRSTSLDARSCQRGIINDDGYLRCPENGGPGYGGPGYGRSGWHGGIPPGDYQQTCQNVRVSGQRLDARCQKKDGGWRDTSLNNFQHCGDRIANVDGRLRCGM